ncbi:MAG: YdhR family protein [Ilumatobacteraceae bacterium]
MIVAVVRFPLDPPLSPPDAAAAFEASAPSYQNVPGLMRKHYLLGEGGNVGGGVYLWESRAAAEALYDDAWSARIEARYGQAPVVEYFESAVTVDPDRIEVG